MKQIRIYCWICIFLFAGFSIDFAHSQNPAFDYADSLYQRSEYHFASIEYERAFFYAEDNTLRAQALLKKSDCLKAIKEFNLAEKCMHRVNYSGLADSLMFLCRFQTALCAYLGGNFTIAESQFLQMINQVKDSAVLVSSLPLFALVLNELNRWDEAREILIEYINQSGFSTAEKDSLLNLAELWYQNKNQPGLIKVERAKFLSSILPGSGQLYSGYFWEGFANATMQGLTLLAIAYGAYTGYYATSVVIGLGLFQKLYVGAIVRTEYLANKRNYELTRNYNNSLKEIITGMTGLK